MNNKKYLSLNLIYFVIYLEKIFLSKFDWPYLEKNALISNYFKPDVKIILFD